MPGKSLLEYFLFKCKSAGGRAVLVSFKASVAVSFISFAFLFHEFPKTIVCNVYIELYGFRGVKHTSKG